MAVSALGAVAARAAQLALTRAAVVKNVFFIIVNNKFFVLYAGITRIRFSGYDLSPK